MVRAIVKNGRIEPVEPLPADWEDGSEVVVDLTQRPFDPERLEQWSRDCDKAAAEISPEAWQSFKRAVEEHQREAKEQMQREMGLE